MEKIVLTEREAAEYIGMSRGYLRHYRMYGFRPNHEPGPSYLKIGRAIRYKKADLDEWLTRHLIQRQYN